MKNLTLVMFVLVLLTAAQSCREASNKEVSQNKVLLDPNDSLFHVNQGGYEFNIILPKDLMIANSPQINMNEATGDLHIHVGENFWIVASLEKTDMQTIKTSINEDMLFTSRVIEETNSSILFQRLLPDGSEYDYNFRSICEIGGKPYIFRTSEEGEFSMESVNRMKHAISSIQHSV